MAKIHFLTQGLGVTIPEGSEFLEIHTSNPDLPLKFGCKKGNCGVCAINVVKGFENLTQKSNHERETLKKRNLDENHRLACQCALNGDLEIK